MDPLPRLSRQLCGTTTCRHRSRGPAAHLLLASSTTRRAQGRLGARRLLHPAVPRHLVGRTELQLARITRLSLCPGVLGVRAIQLALLLLARAHPRVLLRDGHCQLAFEVLPAREPDRHHQ